MAGNELIRWMQTIAVLITLTCTCVVRADEAIKPAGGKMFAIAIHGGAGTLSTVSMRAANWLAGCRTCAARTSWCWACRVAVYRWRIRWLRSWGLRSM